MQKFEGSCSPEQLQTLQKIFDLIWMELRASSMSSYSGPSDADELRDQIARRVLDCYDGNGTPSDDIIRQVLASFGLERPSAAPTNRPKTSVVGKEAR